MYKNKTTKENQQKGFIKIIVILIIVLIVANFLGFNPEYVWNNFISPGIDIIWKIAVWAADILYSVFKIFFNIVLLGIEMFKRVF